MSLLSRTSVSRLPTLPSSRQYRQVTAGRIPDAVLGLGRLPYLGVNSGKILSRFRSDKKTPIGIVHCVLTRKVDQVEIMDGVPEPVVPDAIDELPRLSRR